MLWGVLSCNELKVNVHELVVREHDVVCKHHERCSNSSLDGRRCRDATACGAASSISGACRGNVTDRRILKASERGGEMTDLRRYASGAVVMVAMLAGCGGHASNGVMPTDAAPSSFPYHKSFYYTGSKQSFEVPSGVRNLDIVARGAVGDGNPPAGGGRVHATIPVTPGEKLWVFVGGAASARTGGFNGGANGGPYGYDSCFICSGSGGGGASDIRQGGDGLKNRVVVAGGSGGQGGDIRSTTDHTSGGTPGKGGGAWGGSGGRGAHSGSASELCGGAGGGGGRQTVGGTGGAGAQCVGFSAKPGRHGKLGSGGAGAGGRICTSYGYECSTAPGGGGGGGGYYGGGGGGAAITYQINSSRGSGAGGGGGGGSSYVEPQASKFRSWQGWKTPERNGLVVISW
jgi:hypothetical protein